jgi:hypothetical protein
MSERIMNLPIQDEFNTRKLANWKLPNFKPLFDHQDEFVLTGERATTYQGNPKENDTCAWRAMPRGDALTRSFIEASPWIKRHIINRWQLLVHRIKPTDDQEPFMQYENIVAAMDTLACLTASVLLAATVIVLVVVRPLRFRVALIGVFGILFALLLRLLAGCKRSEVIGITAAFYAVTAVFVSPSISNCASN